MLVASELDKHQYARRPAVTCAMSFYDKEIAGIRTDILSWRVANCLVPRRSRGLLVVCLKSGANPDQIANSLAAVRDQKRKTSFIALLP